MRLPHALTILFLLLQALAQGVPPTVTQEQYLGFRQLVFELVHRFPPDKYYYVSIGRTPTPIMRLMQELEIVDQTTVPLSGIRDWETLALKEKESLLKKRLEQSLPSPSELNGKNIIVIDYLLEGTTLGVSSRYLSALLRERKINAKVIPLGLILSKAFEAKAHGQGFQTLVIPPSIATALQLKEFSPWAKFPYSPLNESKPPVATSEYEEMGQSLREWIRQDPLLEKLREELRRHSDQLPAGIKGPRFSDCLVMLTNLAQKRFQQLRATQPLRNP